ncbi:hypothetical protein CTAM01_08746 [Colletotrichum tamarilloi]|uniref:Uncharacterized protein n=1 Tax=Colletotrichum tamarilloi TaxID=1209934 RepID=A0ABQ9R5Q4_9PEZI|nr:uncharacterized protein CTAM01_08746 [Colletotrichum tamarilloi]KAK1495291.1 hypothetical protein CTAM01_08746 [Colletotrichum tamarilloi]
MCVPYRYLPLDINKHIVSEFVLTLYSLGRCLGDYLPSMLLPGRGEDGRTQWRRGEISAASGTKLFHLVLGMRGLPSVHRMVPYLLT